MIHLPGFSKCYKICPILVVPPKGEGETEHGFLQGPLFVNFALFVVIPTAVVRITPFAARPADHVVGQKPLPIERWNGAQMIVSALPNARFSVKTPAVGPVFAKTALPTAVWVI